MALVPTDRPEIHEATGYPADLDLVCPGCGYSLHGIASERCPECGMAVDRAGLSVSRLPWAHRREIGGVRAYWRTNLMVLLRPRMLAQEMNRPVRFADSQRFRHVTVLLGCFPVLVWGVGLLLDAVSLSGLLHGSKLGWTLEGIDCVAIALGAWLLLFMLTGVASYFYHPPSLPIVRQNRAISLSYYTCAPLAWAVVPAVLFGLAAGIESEFRNPDDERLAFGLIFLGTGASLLIVVLWWWRLLTLMRRTTHCGLARSFAMALYLPVSWIMLYCVCAAIPLSVIYISLVIMSFH